MARQLRVLTVLTEDPGSQHSHRTTIVTPVPGIPLPLLASLGTGTQVVHMYACRKVHVHTLKFNFFLKIDWSPRREEANGQDFITIFRITCHV